MLDRVYHFTVAFLWRALLTLLVGLAIVVSTLTVMLSMLPSVNDVLTEAIETRTGFRADIGALEGEMSGFRPRLKVTDLIIYEGGATDKPPAGLVQQSKNTPLFQAGRLQITVNPWRSLLQRQVILSEMTARDVDIPARLENAAGSIVIPIDPGVFASEIERLTLQNTKVSLLRNYGDEQDKLELEVDLDLKREGSFRELQLSARGDGDLSINATGAGMGDPFDLRGFRGGINGQITASNIAAMASFFDLPVSGQGDILFWTDAANGVFASTFKADGQVSIRTAANSSNEIALSVLGVAESEGSGAWLNFETIDLALDEARLTLENIHLGLFMEEWSVLMNDVNIAAAAATVLGTGLLPQDVADIIQSMRPSGQINAVSLAGDYRSTGVRRAAVDIRNLGIIENAPLPGISNLSATVGYENGVGSIQVQSEDFSFSIPTQFKAPLALGSVSAVAGFKIVDDRVLITDGRAYSDAGDFIAKGLISGSLPLNTGSAVGPELSVVLGAKTAPSDRVLTFTPYTIDPEAYAWMQSSIGEGAAKDVGFVMRGGLRRREYPLRSIQVSAFADLETVQLMPGLPPAKNLKGHVSVDNALVTFDLSSAEVGTLQVPSALVQVGRVEGVQLLKTYADVVGTVPNAINEIASIPYVPDNVGEALRRLNTQGSMTAQFELSLPIKGAPRIPEITTRGWVADTQFSYEGLPFTVVGVQGDIVYQYPQGISGGTLEGHLFEEQITLNLNPELVDLDLSAVGFSLFTQANLSASNLAGLAGLQVPQTLLAGKSEFSIALQAGSGVRLQVLSDLVGLESLFPAPFNKAATASLPLELDLEFSAIPHLALTYGDVLSGVAVQKTGGGWSAVTRIGADLDDGLAVVDKLPENTVAVGGQLTELDLTAWSDAAAELGLSSAGGSVMAQWEAFDIDSLQLGAAQIPGVVTSGQYGRGDLSAEWVSDLATGHVDYNRGANLISARVTSLDLDQLPDFGDDSAVSESSKSRGFAVESDLPHVSVDVGAILLGGQNLGSLSFELDATPDAISVSSIDGVVDGVTFGEKNEVVWMLGDTPSTKASITLELGPSDTTLTRFNTDSVVNFASGSVSSELVWEGSPLDIAIENAVGQAELQLNGGSFLPVSSQATGPLRFISIFNLAGLVQRANVNQLFDPGLTFDKATGDLTLDGERVVINEFAIRNGGGSLDLGGNFHIARDTIDAELTVTLPLVENIPWVAALAGGLPIAAGAYLASRVFEDQVTRLSSGVYSVTGPASAPEVKFMRVFDARRSAENMGSAEAGQSSEAASDSDRK